MSFATLYARFRGSPAFPALLALCVASWMAWSFSVARGLLPHSGAADVPGEWGTLNCALSIEASVSTSLLLMDMARSEVLLRRQLARIEEQAGLHAQQMQILQHMVESQLALIERFGGADVARVGPAGACAGRCMAARDTAEGV